MRKPWAAIEGLRRRPQPSQKATSEKAAPEKAGRATRGREAGGLLGLLLAGVVMTAAVAQEARFDDVAGDARVDHGGRGRNAAWVDFDGDGRLDLIVGSMQDADVLYRNLGGGAFAEVSAKAGIGPQHSGYAHVWGDYDNDGHLDLFVSRGGFQELRNGNDPDSLYRNNGDGTLTEVSLEAGVADLRQGFGAAWIDYERDGFLDIFVANLMEPNILYRNERNGSFVDVASEAGIDAPTGAHGVAVADYDKDGDVDIFVAGKMVLEGSEQGNVLWRNEGDGSFTDVTDAAGVGGDGAGFCVVFVDFDNDGWQDVFVGSFNHFNDGRFTTLDRRPGLPHSLYRNRADGTFEDVTAAAGLQHIGGSMGVAAADYDNDGFIDLYVAHGGPEVDRVAEPDLLFRNNANGSFTEVSARAGTLNGGEGHGPAFGDFDGDGQLDLYVPNGGFRQRAKKPNLLFRNRGTRNNWLVVQLIGTVSNRAAVGARVRVVAGSLSQEKEVSGGGGFGAQDSLPLEFGLGGADSIDSLEIFWPSGATSRLEQVAANQLLQVREDGRVVVRVGR